MTNHLLPESAEAKVQELIKERDKFKLALEDILDQEESLNIMIVALCRTTLA